MTGISVRSCPLSRGSQPPPAQIEMTPMGKSLAAVDGTYESWEAYADRELT